MVARPICVVAIKSGPFHSKCCSTGPVGDETAGRFRRFLQARQSQIFHAGLTTVLAGYDVVDVEGRRVRGCGHVAILATPLCAIPDAADQALIHKLRASREDSNPAFRRATRARECKTDKTFAMLT